LIELRMLILDTNLISELMRPTPSARVLAWFDAQHVPTLHTTSICWAELTLGLEDMPAGKRKEGLRQTLQAIHERMLKGRILPFDEFAAQEFALVMSRAQKSGYTLGLADGQIAAIASLKRLPVATRDAEPFLAAGLKVINPWDAD
jgi:toxin FitB